MVSLVSILAAASLLPGFTPYASGPAGGSVQTGVFPGEQRPGFVYLPPGFSASRRYPVVYLLHGMPGSPTEYLLGTDLANWADTEIGDGAIRPFIAVLPAAGPRPQYNGEWAGAIAAPLVEQIVPWIDAHLPTISTPRGRVIAGLSAGGFGAVDTGLRHPDLFGTIEAWSAYFSPLHDGPFKHASRRVLAANDPTKLAPALAATLAAGSHALLPLDRPGAQPLVQAGADPRRSHASCTSWVSPRATTSTRRPAASGAPSSTPGSRGRCELVDAIRAQRAGFPVTPLLRTVGAASYIPDPAGRGARVGRSHTKRS